MDQNTLEQQADRAKDVYENGRQTLKQGIQSAKDIAQTASEKSREVMARSKEALDASEDWAKENPWVTVGLIAGAGLLIGLLIGRSRD